MKLSMRLTVEGLVRTLRGQLHMMEERLKTGYANPQRSADQSRPDIRMIGQREGRPDNEHGRH